MIEKTLPISPPLKSAIKRFYAKIKKTRFCWIWLGRKNLKGYGMFDFNNGVLAHRFSYYLHIGEIPKGLCVCHSCDNPSCVNPRHLWIGTHSDNRENARVKNRLPSLKGSKNGNSKLIEEQVIEIKRLLKENISMTKISKQFNISFGSVANIKIKKTWKHIK